MQPLDLQDKKILLTGAGGGIGSALAHQLAAQGAQLFLCNNRQELLDRLAGELPLPANGRAHQCLPADITGARDRERIVTAGIEAGGYDVVINLAGILDFHLFEDQPAAVMEKTIQVNLLAPILLCRELLPQLKQKAAATILNVGSIFGSIGHPGFVVYCASKAGLKTFTEALSRELADTGINVSYIAPRATATSLNTDRVNAMNEALGNKMDTPEFVASRIVAQLRKGRGFKYLGWPEKLFVRINALLPSVVHRALVKNLGLIKQYAGSGSDPV